MGELISLAERRPLARRRTRAPRRPRVSFFFDLASPWTYLAAERVDRRFADVRWQPAVGDALPGGRDARARSAAPSRSRAGELRMPLVWPEAQPRPGAAPCASPRSPSSAAARAEFVAGRQPPGLLRRLRRRRPRDPGRGGRRRRPRPRRVPARRAASCGRDGPHGAGARCACWPGRRRAARARRRPRAVLRRAPAAPRRPPPPAGSGAAGPPARRSFGG